MNAEATVATAVMLAPRIAPTIVGSMLLYPRRIQDGDELIMNY
jgi:hypothetical protein